MQTDIQQSETPAALCSMPFYINHPGEKGGGLVPYNDVVTVQIESGICLGKPGEFQAYMRDCLAKWYDGAQVKSSPCQDDH